MQQQPFSPFLTTVPQDETTTMVISRAQAQLAIEHCGASKAAWLGAQETPLFERVTASYAQCCDYSDAESAIGTSLAQMPCAGSECAPFWNQICHDAMRSQRRLRYVNTNRLSNDQWHIHISLTTAVVDDEQQVIGTYTLLEEVDEELQNVPALIMQLNSSIGAPPLQQSVFQLGQPLNAIDLTEQQQSVLFWLLRGYSTAKIARLLHAPRHSVLHIVETLKFKFNVWTKAELLDKSSQLGYLSSIPQHLFNRQLLMQLLAGRS